MFCYKCGNKLSGEDAFCSRCGLKIKNADCKEELIDDDMTNVYIMPKSGGKSTINIRAIAVIIACVIGVISLIELMNKNDGDSNLEGNDNSSDDYADTNADYNSYLIDEKDYEAGQVLEQEFNNDLDESDITQDVIYTDKPEVCTLDELNSIDTEFAVLQADGMVRPIYSFHISGELEEPKPFRINISDGEKLIAINSIDATIQKVDFLNICPVEISTDDRTSKVLGKGTHMYILDFENIKFIDYIVGTRLPEYDLIDELTDHKFKLINAQKDIFFDNIDGYSAEEMLRYVQNNNNYWDKDGTGDINSYYLPAGSHTFGYYKGTDYIEIVINSSIYKPCGTLETERGNKYEDDIKCDIERTRNGYFMVNIPKECDGMYCLRGENHNKTYCIELVNLESVAVESTDVNLENIDVEAEVEIIRGHYYTPGELDEKREISSGTNDVIYSRQYYYHDGKLYFIFAFNGKEEHRFYYVNDTLIRYIDDNKTVYDKEDASQNCPAWEAKLKTESQEVY